ncbi:MAG: hypothetical protein ABEH64_11145 [Salinirussus sp.]
MSADPDNASGDLEANITDAADVLTNAAAITAGCWTAIVPTIIRALSLSEPGTAALADELAINTIVTV